MKRNGHLPTLIACFLHFDLSFMLWVLLGALGIFIAESVGLTPVEKGLVVAVPLLRKLLKDESDLVRRAAAGALKKLAPAPSDGGA